MSDFWGIGNTVAGIATAGASLLGTHWTNKTNKENVESTNKQNLQLQREAWAREDNAVQRRAKDLAAAGMNPILAAGGAAAAQSPVQMQAPHAERPNVMDFAQTLSLMDQMRTSITQRDLMRANADEHRARAESIRTGTNFDVESWQTRLDSLARNLEVLGERSTLLQLEQENLSLRNRHQESSNIIREVEAIIAPEIQAAGLSEIQERLLRLEIENEMLRMDRDRRDALGIPHSGNIVEKGVIWLLDRTREGAEAIQKAVPSNVQSDIQRYYQGGYGRRWH